MTTRKKGLGKGMDALMPNHAAGKEHPVCPTDEERAGEAVAKVAMVLNTSLAGLDDYTAERMLRMIISLCRSELKGGHHG